MKVQLVSDLHLEFYPNPLLPLKEICRGPKGDVLILAGDICPIWELNKWRKIMAHLTQRYQKILYVPGNHEYYGTSLVEGNHLLKELAQEWKNVEVEGCGSISLKGQTFLMSTLWYPSVPDVYLQRHNLSDFSEIKRTAVNDYVEEGKECFDVLNTRGASNQVWITHHLPTGRSVPERYKSSALSCYYLHDISSLIKKHQPRYIFHGHTHDSCDYMAGDTRVICNPKGYPGALNPNFNPDLVIDL